MGGRQRGEHPAGTSPVVGVLGRQKKVIAVLLGAVVFQLAFVSAFSGAEVDPSLHQVTVGLVGTPPAGPGVIGGVPGSGVSYRRLPDSAAARETVRGDRLPAVLEVTGKHETLVVAGARGPLLIGAIERAVTTDAAAAHAGLAIQDVRPLPAGDPRGVGSFLLVVGWIIGGYLGMTLLSRVLGAAGRGVRGTALLTGWTALYAAASAGLGVLLMDPVMGILTGHPWALLGAGALIVFAAAMFTAAALSLLRLGGIVLAIVVLVVVGNSTSGGPVPNQMLSTGYRFFAEVLPNNAGLSLVRAISYFDGNGTGHPLLILALYAVIASAVCFAMAHRRTRHPGAHAVTGTHPEMAAA